MFKAPTTSRHAKTLDRIGQQLAKVRSQIQLAQALSEENLYALDGLAMCLADEASLILQLCRQRRGQKRCTVNRTVRRVVGYTHP